MTATTDNGPLNAVPQSRLSTSRMLWRLIASGAR